MTLIGVTGANSGSAVSSSLLYDPSCIENRVLTILTNHRTGDRPLV
jgi:hypothetical protein